MEGTPPKPTHEISHILQVKKQHFLILKPLKEGTEEVIISIDEVLASPFYGFNDIELREAE